MKKQIKDFTVVENLSLTAACSLLKLTPADGSAIFSVNDIPYGTAGQFVQVSADKSKTTFLRRPISICNIDMAANELWLLIRNAGDGTHSLIESKPGDSINIMLPLGNGFSMPDAVSGKVLLVGGGVGVAPLFLLGRVLKNAGFEPEFLLGAKSAGEHMMLDQFASLGAVHVTTDDGTLGQKGLVTQHPVMETRWNRIYCCGPAPMMKAVAAKAKASGSECEVSLENMMACGLGACLCCVEKTVKGNVCVCTEGPVFNIKQLTW